MTSAAVQGGRQVSASGALQKQLSKAWCLRGSQTAWARSAEVRSANLRALRNRLGSPSVAPEFCVPDIDRGGRMPLNMYPSGSKPIVSQSGFWFSRMTAMRTNATVNYAGPIERQGGILAEIVLLTFAEVLRRYVAGNNSHASTAAIARMPHSTWGFQSARLAGRFKTAHASPSAVSSARRRYHYGAAVTDKRLRKMQPAGQSFGSCTGVPGIRLSS